MLAAAAADPAIAAGHCWLTPGHGHLLLSRSPRTSPLLAIHSKRFLIHVHVSQCETVLCNDCFAERLRSQVCDVFFAPDSEHSQSLRSDLVLYPQVRHIYVLQLPNSLPVENVLSGFCVNGQHWFHCKTQVKHHALDPAPNAAAYSSASALFFAMTFCLCVYAFRVCLPSISTPALDDFRVSLQSAPSLSAPRPVLHIQTLVLHCLSRFKYLASLFCLSRALLIGIRHLSAQLVHNECYVCSILTEEQTSGNL